MKNKSKVVAKTKIKHNTNSDIHYGAATKTILCSGNKIVFVVYTYVNMYVKMYVYRFFMYFMQMFILLLGFS